MLRRYQDAIRSFESILYYIQRTHSYHSKSAQYDIISRKRDHILGLLALTYALCPQRLDDGVQVRLPLPTCRCGHTGGP